MGKCSSLKSGGKTMRKRIINPVQQEAKSLNLEWINLEKLAEVEITSEDPTHPIESALQPGRSGWRAAVPGKQTIRVIFDTPQTIHRIWISFVELSAERTQEFVLRWSPDDGQTYLEIIRQQWNFSPRGATSEIEDFHLELHAVTVLELSIIPDISGGNALASLAQLRIAKKSGA
jgi:hypothetical protein